MPKDQGLFNDDFVLVRDEFIALMQHCMPWPDAARALIRSRFLQVYSQHNVTMLLRFHSQ